MANKNPANAGFFMREGRSDVRRQRTGAKNHKAESGRYFEPRVLRCAGVTHGLLVASVSRRQTFGLPTPIQRTNHSQPTPIHHMQIPLGGGHIAVPQ